MHSGLILLQRLVDILEPAEQLRPFVRELLHPEYNQHDTQRRQQHHVRAQPNGASLACRGGRRGNERKFVQSTH